MKERLPKWGVSIFLVAILLVPGVLASAPRLAQGAAKGTTYNVTTLKGSALVSLSSSNGSGPGASVAQCEGTTFQMVVGAKANKDKSGTYYPVTIIAKSYKAPTQEFPSGAGMAERTTYVPKDAAGKLYTRGGAVNVTSVMGKKGAVTTIDGAVGPAGSMIIQITLVNNITLESTGQVVISLPITSYFTTGQSHCLVKGTKSGLEGKAMPDDDTTKTLPTPLVGQPVNLDKGTGTLVSTNGTLGIKNKVAGTNDLIEGQIWVMNITK